MKHPETIEGWSEEIRSGARLLGVALTSAQAEIMARHLSAVLEANERLNLTSVATPDEAIRLHVLDSLSALMVVRTGVEGDVADLGSGAGYPGVPLAVASGRDAVLVESVGKKAAFLAGCLAGLGLDRQVSVYAGRAERLALEGGSHFSVVTARAVSSLPSLVELAAPLLRPGGTFIAMKGQPSSDEIQRGDAVASVVGLERTETHELTLPGGAERRTLVVYEKTGTASLRLPRREGMAQRKPLG